MKWDTSISVSMAANFTLRYDCPVAVLVASELKLDYWYLKFDFGGILRYNEVTVR